MVFFFVADSASGSRVSPFAGVRRAVSAWITGILEVESSLVPVFAAELPMCFSAGAQRRAQGNAVGSRPEFSHSERPSEEKSVDDSQQNATDGVEEDMATLVLGNPVPGVGSEHLPVSERLAGVDAGSDAETMLRAAAGDEAAFQQLVVKYHRPMIHFLFRMTHNQAVAEELAQEVFLRVYRSRESYRAEARFTTWLYRIATNLAVNHARDTRHERTAQSVCLDEPDEKTGNTPEVADGRISVEQQMLQDERMAAIRQHVLNLPERQRMAVLMHKYQELDYRQIGEVLKLSESATKSLLFRAYQTLRESLKEFV